MLAESMSLNGGPYWSSLWELMVTAPSRSAAVWVCEADADTFLTGRQELDARLR